MKIDCKSSPPADETRDICLKKLQKVNDITKSYVFFYICGIQLDQNSR